MIPAFPSCEISQYSDACSWWGTIGGEWAACLSLSRCTSCLQAQPHLPRPQQMYSHLSWNDCVCTWLLRSSFSFPLLISTFLTPAIFHGGRKLLSIVRKFYRNKRKKPAAGWNEQEAFEHSGVTVSADPWPRGNPDSGLQGAQGMPTKWWQEYLRRWMPWDHSLPKLQKSLYDPRQPSSGAARLR